jgi:hypothetical protein
VEKLGIAEGDVQKLTTEMYYKYGTTMAGLVVSTLYNRREQVQTCLEGSRN